MKINVITTTTATVHPVDEQLPVPRLIPLAIQHVKPLIGERPAIGNAAPRRIDALDRKADRPDRRFGRATEADHLRTRRERAQLIR